jgi:hypothetical protein
MNLLFSFKTKNYLLIYGLFLLFGVFLTTKTGNFIFLLSFIIITIGLYFRGRGEVLVFVDKVSLTYFSFLTKKNVKYQIKDIFSISGILPRDGVPSGLIIETHDGNKKYFKILGMNLLLFKEMAVVFKDTNINFDYGTLKK